MEKINRTLSDINNWLHVPDGYKLIDVDAQGSYIHVLFSRPSVGFEGKVDCWEVYLNTDGRPVIEQTYTQKSVMPRCPFQTRPWTLYDFRRPYRSVPERIMGAIKSFLLYGFSFVCDTRREK